jgi:AcrR family transcriptional regulator
MDSDAPGGRQRERSDATRTALTEAAARLFGERGFTDTPTEEIVRAAGVTRGALYHHFTDKEDLFRAVFEGVEEQLVARAAEAVERSEDLKAGLLAGCNEFLDACLEPEVQRIALIDGPAVLGWDEWRKIDERYALGLITMGITAAIAEGVIDPQPARPLAQMLLGALTEAAMLIARSDDVTTTRAEVGTIVERLLTGLETQAPPPSG